jgi:kanamycin nucleotidyltransferase
VQGLRPHTRDERTLLVDKLVDLHRDQLGDNLLGLATQGSYARGSDGAYSDIELVAFLREVPGTTNWADCVQIWQGTLIDIIWTTADEYVARVKDVTPHWYLAGSDHLGALINEPLIDRINAYEVEDRRGKCLEQAVRQWPVTQEATGKVLNALLRENVANLGPLLFAMIDCLLIELAFVNERPYASASTALAEALTLAKQPHGLEDLASLAAEGAYTDLERTSRVVQTVFAGLEDLLLGEGLELYDKELVLRPVPAA